MTSIRRVGFIAATLLGTAGLSSTGKPTPISGIRFIIDTVETNAPARGSLPMFAGRVELAGGPSWQTSP